MRQDTADAAPESISEVARRRVQEVREIRRLSLRDLSARLVALGHRIDKTTLSRIERGDREITLPELDALALALGVSPLSLTCPTDDAAPMRVGTTVTRPAGTIRAWRRGFSLDDDLRIDAQDVPDREHDELLAMKRASPDGPLPATAYYLDGEGEMRLPQASAGALVDLILD